MADKRSISVSIRGQEFRIRTGDDEASMRRVASYVNETMDAVEKRTGTVDSRDVALLTALNLARELVEIREGRHPSVEAGIEAPRMRALIELAEGAIEPAAD